MLYIAYNVLYILRGVAMGEFTGIVKSIINLLKPKSKPEPSDIEYESIIEHLSSKEHLLNELMKCLNDKGT